MERKQTFQYTCSAKNNDEIQVIRKKSLSCKETKLEELKRLNALVQTAGTVSLCVGIGGMLLAYPVYRKLFLKAKEKYRSKILILTTELMGEEI